MNRAEGIAAWLVDSVLPPARWAAVAVCAGFLVWSALSSEWTAAVAGSVVLAGLVHWIRQQDKDSRNV
jgi:hypothetical protein